MRKRIFRRACSQRPSISKATLKASFEEDTPTRDFLESLDDDDWDILSFDAQSREVCVMVTATTGSQIHTLSFTLPVISNSWRR
jgi:hypothetical protein